MFIVDFYTSFMSSHEKSRLFQALRRVSRLDGLPILEAADQWPQWPPITSPCPGLEKA